jgi:2-hydroxychromene-2-carboxylate isomerase
VSIGTSAEHAKLTVVLDIRHPVAYLALPPAIEFARDLGVDIDWLPMRSQTLRPPSPPGPEDDRGVRHKRRRAQMIAREITIYAEARGLELQGLYRDGPATGVELGWLWVRATAPASLGSFLESSFRLFWALELDAESIDEVASVVDRCGLDAGAFRTWAASRGPAAAASVSGQLAEAGVFQTPAYLVADEIFYGRQHLPMIRWLLEGRQGEPPI